MKLKNVILGVFAVLLAVLFIVLAAVLMSAPSVTVEKSTAVFTPIETGVAGQYGYFVFNYRGTGNITLISYDQQMPKSVFIINDPQAIGATHTAELVEQLTELERYGYNVTLTNDTGIGSGIYVVPTGAIPSYVLFHLKQNPARGVVFYIGEKDLMLSSGIKKNEWYNDLTPPQRTNLVMYANGTLDDMLENHNRSLMQDILYGSWTEHHEQSVAVSGNGLKTITVPLDGASSLRAVYALEGGEGAGLYGTYDQEAGVVPEQILTPSKPSMFPWEHTDLQFLLNRTNGTALLSVRKDGTEVQHDLLRRVTDENVFIRRFQFKDPGDYVITVTDNSGPIASGLLHIKDVKVEFVQRSGTSYIFSVFVDGQPLRNTDASVWLGNSSTKKKFYINDGTLVVNARPAPGINTFNIEMLGSVISVDVRNDTEPLLDFYLKYGVPVLALVSLVYFGARLSRKPVYSLRFGDGVAYIRQDLRISTADALEALKLARSDLKLGNAPVTTQEFSFSLKRHFTKGADITDGNIESILKKLVAGGQLEAHREYYQLKGEGSIRRNALQRIVREKLIENGTPFKYTGGKFVTKDYEIGFFGEHFTKKALVIVDDEREVHRILSHLTDMEQARLRILQANDRLVFVPIDRLGDSL